MLPPAVTMSDPTAPAGNRSAGTEPAPIPVIVHLSGRLRGLTQRLRGDHLRIGASRDADVALDASDISVRPGRAAEEAGQIGIFATLERRGASYRLVASPAADIWVNGERAQEMVLATGDVLEIGQGGPLLRFRLYPSGSRAYKKLGEAFSDCVDCARHSGESLAKRTGILVGGVAREVATQTSPLMRAGVAIILASLAISMGGLWVRNVRLERRLTAETVRIRGLTDLLEKAERTTVTLHDLIESRARMETRVTDTVERLEALEARTGARERVIEAASHAVAFLQGAYGFVQPSTGRALRYVGRRTDGLPLSGPDGAPLLTFDGTGPEVEVLYTGTGFVVTTEGHLLTNRHVAAPWEFDESVRAILAQGLEPVMRRFVAYLPGRTGPFDMTLVRASDTADVALLRTAADTSGIRPLDLSTVAPHAGDEIVVLGYPTGIQALMARADRAFVNDLMQGGPLDFWSVAAELARGGYIAPLATMGIIGQMTRSRLVYDAETTRGGSGGPVLDLEGRVIAVNSAVIPEFGGSNLGVPIDEAIPLMAGLSDDGP